MRALAERYQHIIKFSAYGHVHHNAFEIVKAYSDNKNVGMNIITGSLTMQPNNPCFTVIEIDAEYMVPLNFKTYLMNLTESNKQKQPVWYLMNDYLHTYEVADVSPDGLQVLSNNILNNETFAELYLWNKFKRGGDMPTSCDETCRKELYCETVSVEEIENDMCRKEKVDIKDAFMDIAMNIFTDPWIKKTN